MKIPNQHAYDLNKLQKTIDERSARVAELEKMISEMMNSLGALVVANNRPLCALYGRMEDEAERLGIRLEN